MNVREFKAWLEGFEEAIDGKPNQAQWKKIKDKLAKVDDTVHGLTIYKTYSYPTYPLYPPTFAIPAVNPLSYPTITCGNQMSLTSGVGVQTAAAATSWYEQGKLEALQS